MKDWRELVKVEDLPGDLAHVARIIGVEAAVKLAEELGGGTIYVPQAQSAVSAAKQRFILSHAEALARNEITIRDLRMLTGISDKQIARYLSGTDKADPRQVSFL